MSIKHAILGLISEQPMHGYRLKDTFDERVSPMWGLTTAQIYQTLSALERGGLLESRGERIGSRPERRIYRLTDAGKRELAAWLQETPSPWTRPFRADLLLRLMFLRAEDVDRLCRALDRQEHESRHLYARVTQMPRSCAAPDVGEVDILGLFLDGMAHHLDADLKMLGRCRDEVEKWSRARHLDVPSLRPVTTARDEGARDPAKDEPPPKVAATRTRAEGRSESHAVLVRSRTGRDRRRAAR